MSRHSVEIRTLLQGKRLNKSRFNPENSINCIPDFPQIRNLKRSQSSSSLRRKTNPDHTLIEQRYKKLQLNYRQLFQETKVKAQIFTKQKEQLERCKGERQKDKKQIQRLRSMLGFLKKKDFAVQVDNPVDFRCSVEKDTSKASTYSKAQQSTDAGFRQTNDNWYPMDRQQSRRKQSRVRKTRVDREATPKKSHFNISLCNKSATTLPIYSSSSIKQKQNKMKSPLSKYKFIPTLSIN